MISDSERREVASELREMSEDDSFAAEVFCRNDSYDALVLRAIRAVVGKGEIFGVLADLIDRPTCRNVSGHRDEFKCSECRCKVESLTEVCNERGEIFRVPFMPKYCPNCGAEVVDDAD